MRTTSFEGGWFDGVGERAAPHRLWVLASKPPIRSSGAVSFGKVTIAVVMLEVHVVQMAFRLEREWRFAVLIGGNRICPMSFSSSWPVSKDVRVACKTKAKNAPGHFNETKQEFIPLSLVNLIGHGNCSFIPGTQSNLRWQRITERAPTGEETFVQICPPWRSTSPTDRMGVPSCHGMRGMKRCTGSFSGFVGRVLQAGVCRQLDSGVYFIRTKTLFGINRSAHGSK